MPLQIGLRSRNMPPSSDRNTRNVVGLLLSLRETVNETIGK
jgi:hypothetical protein